MAMTFKTAIDLTFFWRVVKLQTVRKKCGFPRKSRSEIRGPAKKKEDEFLFGIAQFVRLRFSLILVNVYAPYPNVGSSAVTPFTLNRAACVATLNSQCKGDGIC